MPIYEYLCRKCGKQFEYLLIPTTTKAAECPKCKSTGKRLEQMISLFATKNESAAARHAGDVKKESADMRYEQHQMERRIANED